MAVSKTKVEVRREPSPYETGELSRLGDMLAGLMGDGAASERVARHAGARMPERGAGQEARVNPNRTPGQGGYLAEPGFDQQDIVLAPRFTSPFADACTQLRLPPGVKSISLPKLVQGVTVATDPDNQPDSSVDLTDTLLTSTVALISGHEDVSLQALEQSPMNATFAAAVEADAAADFARVKELQVLAGTGANGGLVGLLNTTGINTVAYTAAATAQAMWPYFGRMVATTAQARGTAAAGRFVMSSSRGAWLLTSEDLQNRPIGNATPNGQFDLVSYRTILADAMPRNISGSQEPVIFCLPADCWVWQGDATLTVSLEVLSGTLQARVAYRRSVAFICRYPVGVTALLGSGMVPVF